MRTLLSRNPPPCQVAWCNVLPASATTHDQSLDNIYLYETRREEKREEIGTCWVPPSLSPWFCREVSGGSAHCRVGRCSLMGRQDRSGLRKERGEMLSARIHLRRDYPNGERGYRPEGATEKCRFSDHSYDFFSNTDVRYLPRSRSRGGKIDWWKKKPCFLSINRVSFAVLLGGSTLNDSTSSWKAFFGACNGILIKRYGIFWIRSFRTFLTIEKLKRTMYSRRTWEAAGKLEEINHI